jgi:hypothetical protein
MDSINSRYSPTANFWIEFPALAITKPFNKFYKKDNTKDKTFSSTIMWCISKVCDRDTEYQGMELEEKLETIFPEFLDQIKTTKKDYHVKSRKELDVLMQQYTELTTTKLEKALLMHEDKFIARGKYLQGLSYENGDGDTIEKMLEKTPKITDALEEARKKVMAEKDKGVNKGNVQLSLSDDGSI